MSLPTAQELLQHPLVRSAFAAAWADSLVDDDVLRHEEGGWILYDTSNGNLSIRRETPGESSVMTFHPFTANPTMLVAAVYHTHPTIPEAGGMPDPSASDIRFAQTYGFLSFVIADSAIFIIDPDGRVTQEVWS